LQGNGKIFSRIPVFTPQDVSKVINTETGEPAVMYLSVAGSGGPVCGLPAWSPRRLGGAMPSQNTMRSIAISTTAALRAGCLRFWIPG
jgi:hypothetical protein